jgi:hypothetical protein
MIINYPYTSLLSERDVTPWSPLTTSTDQYLRKQPPPTQRPDSLLSLDPDSDPGLDVETNDIPF